MRNVKIIIWCGCSGGRCK